MPRYYLTCRGVEYGPYSAMLLMLRELQAMLENDALHGLAEPTDVTYRRVETLWEREEGDGCSDS